MKTLDGVSILIVDDEEEIREILCDMMKKKGATVLEAESGYSAMAILKQTPVDIVLSDIRMPLGDGISFVKLVKEELTETPIMYLCSGYSDLTKEKAAKIGASGIFLKPFDNEALIAEIQSAVKDVVRKNK